MEMKIEITQLPAISSDLLRLKADIQSLLQQYDFIVNEEDIKATKTKTKELNKLANSLDALRKEKIKEVSAPIVKFDNEAKEIYSLIKEARQLLLNQLAKFENEKKEELNKLLAEKLDSLYNLHNIEPEFQKSSFTDLIIVSNLTKGGNIAKKAIDELTDRVLDDKQVQEKIQGRLIALDGVCLKSGLESPLQKHNVQHFLYSDNYDEQLNNLIKVELKRQDETKKRIAQQLEEKKKREEEALKKEKVAKEEIKQVQEIVKETISDTNNPSFSNEAVNNDNSTKYQITVTMELETKNMDVEMLKRATRNKFIKCGFKSIRDIEVIKKEISPEVNSLLADGSLF